MTSHAVAAEVRTALAPSGTLRAAINFGNPVLAQKDPATGEARGVSVDIARELASRLGAPLALVTFDAAGKVFEALGSGAWDVAFLAIDPKRAAEIDFTAPYVIIEGSYMVRADSPLRAIEDVDRPGVRIAVGDGQRVRALPVAHDQARAARARGHRQRVDRAVLPRRARSGGGGQVAARAVRAGARRTARDGRPLHGDRAGDGHAEGARRAARRTCARFVEELKASGFVADALARHGQHDAKVAPA